MLFHGFRLYIRNTGASELPRYTGGDVSSRAGQKQGHAWKLNHYLGEVSVDYEEDVLPLTPSGNPTERHMLVALYENSRKLFPDRDSLARFWADALQMEWDDIQKFLDRPVELQTLIRSKLMKHGGPGYSMPDAETFPQLE